MSSAFAVGHARRVLELLRATAAELRPHLI